MIGPRTPLFKPEALLTLNARAQLDPARLQQFFTRSLADVAGNQVSPRLKRLAAFSPAPPNPTHHLDTVIDPNPSPPPDRRP